MLAFNKPAHVGMCTSDLSKNCLNFIMITLKMNMVATQNYYSLIMTVWWIKQKPKMFMKILVMMEKCMVLLIILLNQKYYDNLNELVVGKMKDETGGAAIKECVGLKPKIY